MELYLTKQNNAWLDESAAAAVTLEKDGPLQSFGECLNSMKYLEDEDYFGENFHFVGDEIHVLVVVPGLKSSTSEARDSFRECLTFDKLPNIEDLQNHVEKSPPMKIRVKQKWLIIGG
ncbi:Crinkler (CRN) [Phytophthora megakarya]|uniref:Crinkler (CRN) n=1 Tax=Phytophthora megakarya TaxID=4795 RepID=A0A225W3Q8_9STRA|nr:Crinkler (CRN) [Phytophthora megakarya]